VPTGESSRALFRYLPPATRAELLFGSALLVLSLLGARWACQRRSDALALERDSLIVEGKVVQLWTTRGKGMHYHVAYQYPASPDAGAPVLRGEDELPERDFSRLEVGGPLAVKVSRADPTNHLVHGARPRAFSDPAALPIALGVLATLALAGLVNLGWWWTCRRRRAGQLSSAP
jgi:hypothetical protein